MCQQRTKFLENVGGEVLEIKQKLIKIWAARPAAVDCFEDIAGSWLPEVSRRHLRCALSQLAAEGVIGRHVDCDAKKRLLVYYYALNYDVIKAAWPESQPNMRHNVRSNVLQGMHKFKTFRRPDRPDYTHSDFTRSVRPTHQFV